MRLLFENVLFTFVVPGTVAVYAPLWIAGTAPQATGPLLWLALSLLGLGAGIYGWCVWDFARFGRGTPAPIDAPKRLVVRGLYRVTRNPMYVGVLTAILGFAAWLRAPELLLYALAVGSVFHLFVVAYEEPHLAREFGESYERYRAEVGRWLPVPRRSSRSRPR